MKKTDKSFSVVRWTMASSLARAIIGFAQLVLLTRFLTPLEYGLMAVVLVVISYANLFNDMGLSAAFIQRQNINNKERSSLYWMSVLMGGVLMLLTISASPLVAYLFKMPEICFPLMLIATNFLVMSLGQQLKMEAEKKLNFRPLAIIEIIAAVMSFLCALVFAWLGAGVYSLVSASMLNVWVVMLLSWLFLANGWRPQWRLQWREIKSFLRFGGGMVLNNFINHLNSTVDLLLGGRLLGATQLGIYSVPRNLILQIQSMVNPIFTRVGFPLLASIQHDKIKVQEAYLKIMNLTASINAPIYVALIVFSDDFFKVFFGSSFQDAALLMKILAIWGLFRSFINPVGSLLFGLGCVRLSTIWNFSMLIIYPLAIWWGSEYGSIGLSWAMTIMIAIIFIPAWYFLVRPACGLKFLEYTSQVVLPSMSAALAGVFAWICVGAIAESWVRLIIGLPVGMLIYCSLTWILNRNLRYMILDFLNRVDE